MGVLKVLDSSGHSELTWAESDVCSVRAAEQRFAELRSKGYQPFVNRSGEVVRTTTFEPGVAEVIFLRPIVGG
jgi:hypothetical protein